MKKLRMMDAQFMALSVQKGRADIWAYWPDSRVTGVPVAVLTKSSVSLRGKYLKYMPLQFLQFAARALVRIREGCEK